MSFFSSDRSQLRNVSIFGRLMQTLPSLLVFKRKYVLRFKLTARATCSGAENPGWIHRLLHVLIYLVHMRMFYIFSHNFAWQIDLFSLVLNLKVSPLSSRYLSVHNCMLPVEDRLPWSRHVNVPDLHFCNSFQKNNNDVCPGEEQLVSLQLQLVTDS